MSRAVTRRLRPAVSAKIARAREKQPSVKELQAQIALLTQLLQQQQRAGPIEENTITMGEFLPVWKDRYFTSKRKVGTKDAYDDWVRLHILPRFGKMPLHKITEKEIETWRKERMAAGYKASNTSPLKLLKILLRCAVRWEYLSRAPEIIISGKRAKQPYFNNDEMNILVRVATKRSDEDLAMVLLGADAGLRHGEMSGLQWPRIEDGSIRIIEQRDWRARLGTTKNSKERTVPMTTRLATVMARLRSKAEDEGNGAGFVFHRNGVPIHYFTFGYRFRALLKHSGLPKRAKMHSLRHTFITGLKDAGVALSDIMELVGHNDLATTQVYLHTDQEKLSGAIDKLDKSRR